MDLTHVRFQGTPPLTTGRSGPRPGSHSAQARAATDEQLPTPVSGLPAFILEQAGLDPALYREAPLQRRTPACLRAIRAGSVTAGRARVQRHPHLADVALNTLLIGVSEFFRDPMVFRILETMVIPALEQRRRPLRIASIGCSFGAELYSMAMMLAESSLLDRSYLLGVDCRPAAVSQARAGLFAGPALSTLDGALRSRYFEAAPGGWRLVRAVRQYTDWRVLDATRECPTGPWDLVLCRNLFIYLHNHAAEAIFARLTRQLVPGGYLVIGKAERPPASLELTQVGRCVFRTPGA